MLYYPGNQPLGVTIIFSGKDACKEFFGFHDNFHENIFNELIKLPSNFHIRDGNSFWKKSSRPPLDKEWNNPIPCNELTWELYLEILDNLKNLIDLQKKKFMVGPVLDLAKTFCKENELTEVIGQLRGLYSLLLKPKTKVDSISNNIKKMQGWEWYISYPKEWGELKEDYEKIYGENTTIEDFKKACWKLRRYDEDYKK